MYFNTQLIVIKNRSENDLYEQNTRMLRTKYGFVNVNIQFRVRVKLNKKKTSELKSSSSNVICFDNFLSFNIVDENYNPQSTFQTSRMIYCIFVFTVSKILPCRNFFNVKILVIIWHRTKLGFIYYDRNVGTRNVFSDISRALDSYARVIQGFVKLEIFFFREKSLCVQKNNRMKKYTNTEIMKCCDTNGPCTRRLFRLIKVLYFLYFLCKLFTIWFTIRLRNRAVFKHLKKFRRVLSSDEVA